MRVHKLFSTLLAYAFLSVSTTNQKKATDPKTNIDKLRTDVESDGGALEVVSDSLVNITTSAGEQVSLTPGFVAVFDGSGSAKIFSEEAFNSQYAVFDDSDTIDFDDWYKRLQALEASILSTDTTKKPSKPDSKVLKPSTEETSHVDDMTA